MGLRSEAGLLASGPTGPRLPSAAVATPVARAQRDAAGVPGHSGGSAPESHRLPFATDQVRAASYPAGGIVGAVTVNLTRIYTRLGDGGETHLGDMSRVPKTDPRIEAYGEIDELNAHVGVALTVPGMPETYAAWLRRVQNDLFDLGADLSVPESEDGRERLRVQADQVAWLEEACDEVNAGLRPLKSFVLPGGTPAAAQLHVCRTVCRRAERRALRVEGANPEIVRYLNRLSDLLFILSRGANDGDEPLWEPGRFR
jgi:cob(I)alamin adenosyltransferase